MMQLMNRESTRSPKRGSGRSCFSAAVKDLLPIAKLLWLGGFRPRFTVHRAGRADAARLLPKLCSGWATALPRFYCLALAALGAVLGPALLAAFNPEAVERATDDVVPNAGKVADAAAADQDDRVLLQVVT